MSEPTPAGWYDDPHGAPSLLRWWDGRQWTEATEPAQGPSPEPMYGQAPAPLYGQQPPPGYGPPPPDYSSPHPDYSPLAPNHGPPAGGRSALPWLLGGAAVAVAVIVAVTVVVSGLPVGRPGPARTSESPSSTGSASASATAATGTRSAVTGTITDAKAGISYVRLGTPWTTAGTGWTAPSLFDAGEVSVVQAPFQQYDSFNATNLSGVPRSPESTGYTGPQDLPTVAQRVTGRILAEHFNMAKTQTTLASRGRTVDGHQAWLEKLRLDFPDAGSRGWKFSADTVAVLVVDSGNGRLGMLWVSVPDTFNNQGDVDQVLDSVKVA